MCVSSSFRTPNFKICKYLTNRISIECSLLLSIGEPSYRTIYACTRVCNKTERRRGTWVRKEKERKGKDEGNSRDGNKRYTTRRIDRIFQHFVTSVISASITIPFGDGRSITDPRIGERRGGEERRGAGGRTRVRNKSPENEGSNRRSTLFSARVSNFPRSTTANTKSSHENPIHDLGRSWSLKKTRSGR